MNEFSRVDRRTERFLALLVRFYEDMFPGEGMEYGIGTRGMSGKWFLPCCTCVSLGFRRYQGQ